MRSKHFLALAAVLLLPGAALAHATGIKAKVPPRPAGPCDIYAAAGDPCVAAYSTTRALYASYNGPLYQIRRQSDGRFADIGVAQPAMAPVPDGGGYAEAALQDAFCAGTYCWITKLYDQSPKHNDLMQAPRGGWSGPALGGMDNVPLADMAPVMVLGHEVYGVFLEPGMGLRDDDPRGTAVDDQAEGQYWVVNGRHFNSGCCNDFGNAEIDSRDDDAGTMETTYFGDAPWWFHGRPPGPWVMTDQENNLVGCVNPDGSNLCQMLPNIHWQFVTGVAKGQAHHWTSLGGNAQRGPLTVMFSGPRVDWQYDPMRKQGGIVLGNGGDNSNGSQGTFYEGAMTAAGTFPADGTDRRVQSNVVGARYRMLPVSIAPAAAALAPPGLQAFSPGAAEDTTVTFTNTASVPARDIALSISVPSRQWTAVLVGGARESAVFAGPVAPGASVRATFRVTSGPEVSAGDLIGKARWTEANDEGGQFATRIEKVRNVPPVRINEFRIGTSSPANGTNSFIELYNAGSRAIDISHWTLTEHPSQQAIFSTAMIPAGTRLAASGFYLLGLADSGLAADAHPGDTSLYVRSTDGIKAGDLIRIGDDSRAEARRVIRVGTPAGLATTLWQPLPDGRITVPPGSTNVPVEDASGFTVGQKIALGYGSTYPTVPMGRERYEVATVTAVGKPGTQAYLAVQAAAGSTNIKVTDVKDISIGDRIRLDIDSVGHGIETVTVAKVGSAAIVAHLARAAGAGAKHFDVREASGFAVGDKMIVETPALRQTVIITSVGGSDRAGVRVTFAPALRESFPKGAKAIDPGTGLDLTAPLRFTHAANLPFSDRGTGISFQPATRFAHISDDPVQPLGTGISIDRPLAEAHVIHAAVRDAAVTTAGYQGAPAPNQWFGGPELTAQSPLFGHFITVRAGSMVLRNASGWVVDSLDYGGLVDPWAAQGYQAVSGLGKDGCYVAAPGDAPGTGVSASRLPDGSDSDSNCKDFVTAPVTTMPAAAAGGATNIKVADTTGFKAGQTVRIDAGAQAEIAVVAKVGTAGATTMRMPISAGAMVIPVGDAREFHEGQAISVGGGARRETAVVSGLNIFDSPTITVAAPLAFAHGAGTEVSGSGITLTRALTRHHPQGTQIAGSAATPGARNRSGGIYH